MDWQLRIALIIAGCALVGYIYYDYSRKKKLQKENEKLKKQFGNISENVDSTGFDHVGVGTPRPASSKNGVVESTSSNETEPPIEGTSVGAFIKQSLEQQNISGDFVQKQTNKIPDNDLASNDFEGVTSEHLLEEVSDDPENELGDTPDKAMVLSLILQAPQGSHFKGRDFLPLFLSQGLRHGEMGIFHRRARAGKEPGPVLFSLANGIAPGVFDINNMENFETPALACFVTLPGPDDAQVAYNAMYKTCLLLQQELGGELLDETKSVYSKQTHNHRLDQIKDYSFKFGC